MQLQIKQAFVHPDTPRPFQPGEFVTVPDELGEQWIAEGKAILFAGAAKPVEAAVPPRHRQREKAVKVL